MFDDARPSHALMQDPAFAKALHLCGQTPVHLPGGLMLLQRRIVGLRLCMLPRAHPPDDLGAQLNAVGLHRARLILSPETPTVMPRCTKLRAARTCAIWDLTQGPDAMRRALHAKWRNQLVRAERLGIAVTRHRLAADPNGPVLRTAAQQARQRGYTNWPTELTAAFASVAPKQTHVFRATDDDQEVAHMVFLSHGSRVTYHLGHITESGKHLNAHNLLLWRAARHFAKHGMTSMDLGLVDAQTPDLDRFKLRTGARAQATGGTYLYWRPFARS